MKLNDWKFSVIIIIFILLGGGCYLVRSLRAAAEFEPLSPPEIVSAGSVTSEAAPTEYVQQYYVHICGAVKHEGVFTVLAGERIFRVLELAGGFTEDAAGEYLNLAAEVTDGMKLYVPTREELESQKSAGVIDFFDREVKDTGGKLDLNTATKDQLMSLKGIGEAKAKAIIKYRDEQGKFNAIEEIMNISGIKQSAFDKIKDDITVLK